MWKIDIVNVITWRIAQSLWLVLSFNQQNTGDGVKFGTLRFCAECNCMLKLNS